MKKLILPISLILLGLAAAPLDASAQRYEAPSARVAVNVGPAWGGRVYGTVSAEMDRLNRELRIVRAEIRNAGRRGRLVRGQFEQVARSTDRLNAQFARRSANPYEIRRRASALRHELDQIRRDLRVRHGGWR